MKVLIPLVILAGLVGACGPSAATLRAAHEASYDTSFPDVWNAISDEVHRRYPAVSIEDPIGGVVVTAWRTIEVGEVAVSESNTANETANRSVAGQFTTCLIVSKVFRILVRVSGPTKTGPWRIAVDGEAAECQPGNAMLIPFKHGQPDEPPWVQSRIDTIAAAIHNRLKKHAVKAKAVPRAVIASKVHDDTPWANVIDRQAAAVIVAVHKAAVARDTAALRPSMSDDFAYNFGAEGSAETALMLWSADPSRMRELAKVLENGCASEGEDVVCPTRPISEKETAVARFRKVAGEWKLVEFAVK